MPFYHIIVWTTTAQGTMQTARFSGNFRWSNPWQTRTWLKFDGYNESRQEGSRHNAKRSTEIDQSDDLFPGRARNDPWYSNLTPTWKWSGLPLHCEVCNRLLCSQSIELVSQFHRRDFHFPISSMCLWMKRFKSFRSSWCKRLYDKDKIL